MNSQTPDPQLNSAPSATPTKELPYKIKGTLTVLNDRNDCEFRAQRSTGESNQVIIRKAGGAKLYKTVGKKPQVVAHLVTKADSSDPVSDLYDQLDRLADKEQAPQKPRRKFRTLLNESGVIAYLNNKERKIYMQLQIDLNATPDYTNELIKQMQKISQCFLINQAYIRKPVR